MSTATRSVRISHIHDSEKVTPFNLFDLVHAGKTLLIIGGSEFGTCVVQTACIIKDNEDGNGVRGWSQFRNTNQGIPTPNHFNSGKQPGVRVALPTERNLFVGEVDPSLAGPDVSPAVVTEYIDWAIRSLQASH